MVQNIFSFALCLLMVFGHSICRWIDAYADKLRAEAEASRKFIQWIRMGDPETEEMRTSMAWSAMMRGETDK